MTTLHDRGVKCLLDAEDENSTVENFVPTVLRKSYSPVQLPTTSDYFDLLVKAYPYRPGGGVGAFLCNLEIGNVAVLKVKPQGSREYLQGVNSLQQLVQKWPKIGLVAGGTGIAPLMQIARTALEMETQIHSEVSLLYVNREEQDILMREELDDLASRFSNHSISTGKKSFKITYVLSRERECQDHCVLQNNDNVNIKFIRNGTRGDDPDIAKQALPHPSSDTIVLVCGTDGFVATWAGPIVKKQIVLEDGTKKKEKVQGPTLGILKECGFDETMVYKY